MLRPVHVACLACGLGACGGQKVVLGGDGDAGCAPGTYAGQYTCAAVPDASFQYEAGGVISLTLTGDRGGPTLYIAPGAKIAGSQQGVGSSADLSGTLDCATNRLAGSLGNVTYQSGGITAAVKGKGAFSADYAGGGSPPALVNGTLAGPPSLNPLGGTLGQGTCAWSATLQ